jgi:hypothetical protein
MSKQENEEYWDVIIDEKLALREIIEELKPLFPDAKIVKDETFGHKIVANLQADEDVWLHAVVETPEYFLSVSYEKEEKRLAILLILNDYLDVSYDLPFIYWFMLGIKNMIQNYNRGKEIELFDAMMWINSFVAREKRWKACEKNDKLMVCLRPHVLDDDEGTYVSVYKARGEISTPNLCINFYPKRGKMRFIIDGSLTTKRFSSLLDIIACFQIE